MGKLIIKWKSGRISTYEDVNYCEFIPEYNVYAVGSIHFKGHEKRFKREKISEIKFWEDLLLEKLYNEIEEIWGNIDENAKNN